MSLKVYKRDTLLLNTIFFCILAFCFLHIVFCIHKGVSSFDLITLREHFIQERIVVLLGMLSIVSILLTSKKSVYIMATYFLIVTFKSYILFFDKFDKILLGLNVLFLIVSYFYCLFVALEFKESVYNPGYKNNYLGKFKSYYDLPIKVALEDGRIINGHLTNWAINSCFVHLSETGGRKIKGKVVLNIKFEDRRFVQLGKIVTGYCEGIGIKFIEKGYTEEGIYSWKDFFTIVGNRGLRYPYV